MEDRLIESKQEAAGILKITLRGLYLGMREGSVPHIKTDFLSEPIGAGRVYFSYFQLFNKDYDPRKNQIEEAQERRLSADVLEATANYDILWIKIAKEPEEKMTTFKKDLDDLRKVVKDAEDKLIEFRKIRIKNFFCDSAERFFPTLYGKTKPEPNIQESTYERYPTEEERIKAALDERRRQRTIELRKKKAVKIESTTVWYDEEEGKRRGGKK